MFIQAFKHVAKDVHDTSVQNGFWDNERNIGEALALIHSEISEALEAHRGGNKPDDKLSEFSGFECELADAVIRIMDLAVGLDLKVAEAIVAKGEYNKSRGYKHGKDY